LTGQSPARIRPAATLLAALAGWLERPWVWSVLAGGSALLCALIYFGLIRPSFPARPRVDFPARPRLDAAIAAAQVRLSADPQDLAGLVELGMLHFEKGPQSFLEAVNELEDARRLGALDTRIFYALGVMYQELGLYPFALEEFQRHLRNFPDDKEVRQLAAKLLYRQGDFPAAVKEYERLRYHDPDDPLVNENLGLSLWSAKLTERAVEVFEALQAAGGLPGRRARFYLGQIAYEAGRYADAQRLIGASLPDDAEPDFGIPKDRMHAAMAMTLQKLQQPDEARESWQRVLTLSPGDAKAQAALRELNRRFPPKKTKKR
jgi:tetratricopeptide (TPR) repeat protein